MRAALWVSIWCGPAHHSAVLEQIDAAALFKEQTLSSNELVPGLAD